MTMPWIIPHWPAPANVKAISTTRVGGISGGVYRGLNLGNHVGDEPVAVAANRQHLQRALALETPLNWLNQVHGWEVHAVNDDYTQAPDADAAFSQQVNQACIVMTADCLPVLFCNQQGTVVAAAHAGWRGLLGDGQHGVLEATIQSMAVDPSQIMAWFGPAIGPQAFEVGDEVRSAFVAGHSEANAAFVVNPKTGKWLADIYLLARQRLARAGVSRVYGGEYCTVSDPARFYSYRRDGQCGRMASLIWLTP